MTPTPVQDELALARDRKRVSAEYARASALLHEHPGAQVRTAVLAAAHADATRRTREIAKRKRWRVTSAVAATLVVGTFAGLIGLHSERPAEPVAVQDSTASIETSPRPQGRAGENEAPRTGASEAFRETTGETSKESSRNKPARPAPATPRSAVIGVPAELSPAPQTPASPGMSAPAADVSNVAEEANSAQRARMAERSAATLMRKATGAAAAPAAVVPAPLAPESDPVAWLERIKQLRARGLDDEADVQLKKFSERYPKLEVPEGVLRKPAPMGSPY